MKLKDQYEAAKAAAQGIYEAAKSEGRDMTDDERTSFEAKAAEAKELRSKWEQHVSDKEALADIAADLPDIDAPTPAESPKGAGETFVKSAAFQHMTKTYGSNIPDQAAQLPAVQVGGFKTLVTSPASTLTANPPVIIPTVYGPLSFANAFTMVETTQNAVDFVTSTFTNAAATVAEGAVKPESALAWSTVSIAISKIAHHIPVTTEALSDYPQIRDIIDNELVRGVQATAETNVATAVDAWAGLPTQAFATSMLQTLRTAIGTVKNAGHRPTGILMNPANTLSLDLLVGSDGHYIGTSPFQYDGNPRVWGLPVYESTAVPSGFAYVGDLSSIIVYYRQGITVSTGWVNDDFTRNQLRILAEARLGVGIRHAAALVKADIVTP